MKNIYGVIVKNGKKEIRQCEELVTKEVNLETQKEMIRQRNNLDRQIDELVPFWVTIGAYLMFLGGLIFLGIYSCISVNKGFKETFISYYWMLISAISLIILFLATMLITKIRMKIFKNSKAFKEEINKINEIGLSIEKELDLPSSCLDLDILLSGYVENDEGKLEQIQKNMFINMASCMYFKDDKLCISDFRSVYTLPKGTTFTIEEVMEEILISSWNKKESFSSPKYKEYFVKETPRGIVLNSYLKLICLTSNEEYYFISPLYEKENIKEILKI